MRQLVVDVRMMNDSGIGTYIKNIIPFLKDKFDLTLLGNKKNIEQFSAFNNIPVINFTAKIYSIQEQILYPIIIPRCNVFWSPHINVPILPIKAINIVTTIHDLNHLSFNNNFNFLKKTYAKLLYKNAIKKSNKVITVSEFSKSEIIKFLKVQENSINVIYGGVSENFFLKNNLKLNLKLPNKYFLFVGNVKPHKNLITLLEAFNELPKEILYEYKLVIVGKKEGFITQDLKVFKFIELNNLTENIFFTGFIDDKYLPNIYQNASLFIFPSLYEGFGLPILESMASKTIVLSSNFASLPEVGGDCVYYFNPKDKLQLKNKVMQILKTLDSEDNFIDKAYQRSKEFSWENSAKKHLKVINEFF